MHAMQALSQLSYSPVSGVLDGYCWILLPPPLAQRLQRRQDYIAISTTNATHFIAFTAIHNIIPHPKEKPAWWIHHAGLVLAEWTGLEPATPGVTGRYSNRLNYHSLVGCHLKLLLETTCWTSDYALLLWRPLGDSNPCTHRERVMS
ncbi:hypothetical protein CBM2633_A70418 [Cupriavidus taiwanensis]|uniref:Uncharacterized protein n=1 Tax=Cupriavidus taiwanensis TaxID=164546 RepID=A0A976G1E1_9BURK|nr:hypothetical protein CBM2604_A90023 [Cupriavidus taiwanensis]SOZ23419.1 hypothetical protein CBM2609_A110024 [Cupriavidus taiwanensis]SOZ43837.1 hypothetical protein CBM2610_A110023 [Cupriavidus taiwanensis]SOZ52750.1 hypothetical protein CBM2615_A240342 [Cupriavidus taiwanensis]SOZ54253.1 hypothetical protein CBM2614_A210344 [Cupriavidus taiwanensis]